MAEQKTNNKKRINILLKYLDILLFWNYIWFYYDRNSYSRPISYVFLIPGIMITIYLYKEHKSSKQQKDKRNFIVTSARLFRRSKRALIYSILLLITQIPFFSQNFGISSKVISFNQILLLMVPTYYCLFFGPFLALIRGIIAMSMLLSILINKKYDAVRFLALSIILYTFSCLIGFFWGSLL